MFHPKVFFFGLVLALISGASPGSSGAWTGPSSDEEAAAEKMANDQIAASEPRTSESPAVVHTTTPEAPHAHSRAADASQAATQPPSGKSFFDKIQFSGLVDGYYGYNFNRPSSRQNALRNFDFNHNQFSLNLVELALKKEAEPLGFRLDLNLGDTAKWVHAAEPGGSDVYQYLQQAYFTYEAPAGRGLSLDFGKFVTHMGAEVIETHANYNYSRSLVFSWAIPYYHFGARISYPFSDKLTVSAHIVNGWNNVVDNNSAKSVGIAVSYSPHSKLTILQNYMVGAEQQDNGSDLRQVFDTVLILEASEQVSLMANYDYGMDRVLGERVRWQGLAGYMHVAFTPWFAVTPRIEWFQDPQGFATGLTQTVREVTLTTEFKVKGGLVMRGEYRRDWSNQPFFEKRAGLLSRSQTTATMGLIYVLGEED